MLQLPDWVVCPLCHGDLETGTSLDAAHQIRCRACGTAFPVKSGIPELLDEAGRLAAEGAALDTSAGGYHAARHVSPCNEQYYDYWCEDLLARLPPRRFGRVAELMAGGAELSRRARGLPPPIVAVDLNRVLLELSREELVPDVVPVCATAERLPFRDASLDLVLIQGGLHHVRRKVEPVLREIARCMAPGAVLLASEPRNDNAFLRGFRRLFYRLHPIPDADEEDGFTRAELVGLFRRAGLTVDQYDPFAYLGYVLLGNTDLLPIFRRMGRNRLSSLLIEIDRQWARLPLARGLGWASQIRAYENGTREPTEAVTS